MTTPSDFAVFTLAGRDSTLNDLMRAAVRWDLWDDVVRDVRRGLACAASADAVSAPNDRAMDSAATVFRYERNLITAADMDAWLEQWQISVDEWMEYIRRSLLRATFDSQLDEIDARYAPSADDVASCVYVEFVCSGALGRVATQLAQRAAATARATEERWVDPIDPRSAEGWLDAQDAGYEVFARHVATDDAIRHQVEVRRLDWIRLACSYVRFSSEPMAREGAMCVRDDGLTLEEVARSASLDVFDRQDLYIGDADPDVRDALLAATPGELVGPLKWGDTYALFLIHDKMLPSVDDPAVHHRALDAVLRLALEREAVSRVTWHKTL